MVLWARKEWIIKVAEIQDIEDGITETSVKVCHLNPRTQNQSHQCKKSGFPRYWERSWCHASHRSKNFLELKSLATEARFWGGGGQKSPAPSSRSPSFFEPPSQFCSRKRKSPKPILHIRTQIYRPIDIKGDIPIIWLNENAFRIFSANFPTPSLGLNTSRG